MSVIFDNNFSKDSNATRTARLLTIQQNFASIYTNYSVPFNLLEVAESL